MLVQSLIAQICVGMSTVDYTACSKALEATSIQCHIAQDVGSLEDYVTTFATRKVTENINEKIIGVVGFTAKIVRDKSLSYPVIRRSIGIIPSVSMSAGVGGGSIGLGWELQ